MYRILLNIPAVYKVTQEVSVVDDVDITVLYTNVLCVYIVDVIVLIV